MAFSTHNEYFSYRVYRVCDCARDCCECQFSPAPNGRQLVALRCPIMKRGRPTLKAVRAILRALFESHRDFNHLSTLQKRAVYRSIEEVHSCRKEDRQPLVNSFVRAVGGRSSETLAPEFRGEAWGRSTSITEHLCYLKNDFAGRIRAWSTRIGHQAPIRGESRAVAASSVRQTSMCAARRCRQLTCLSVLSIGSTGRPVRIPSALSPSPGSLRSSSPSALSPSPGSLRSSSPSPPSPSPGSLPHSPSLSTLLRSPSPSPGSLPHSPSPPGSLRSPSSSPLHSRRRSPSLPHSSSPAAQPQRPQPQPRLSAQSQLQPAAQPQRPQPQPRLSAQHSPSAPSSPSPRQQPGRHSSRPLQRQIMQHSFCRCKLCGSNWLLRRLPDSRSGSSGTPQWAMCASSWHRPRRSAADCRPR
jgi:hypothetical protein